MTPDGVDLSDQEYLKRSFHGGNMWQHAATCVNMPIRQINASCYHHVIASLHIVAYRCISLHLVAYRCLVWQVWDCGGFSLLE